MSLKILITGGAGFVGSHVVDACLARGDQVTVFDNFAKGRREFLPKSDNLRVIEGDIRELPALAAAVDTCAPAAVFHLAAVHYIPECEQFPADAIRVNIEGTQNVLTTCRNRVGHLILASTGAIYDPDTTGALSELSPVRTADVYGITKATAEELVRHHVRKGFGKVSIARLFNVVGPRETNQHLIPAVMEQLSKSNLTVELGNLFPKRDYIHVRDIAAGLVSIMAANRDYEVDVFNIGSGVEYSVGELVELCGKATGLPLKVESVAARRRKYDRPSQVAEIGKMKRECGWAPTRTLFEALQEVWAEKQDGVAMRSR